jgi:predicted secreted hydrolase
VIYRTQAFMGSTGMVVYHGRSFELASQAWHDSQWASIKVLEQLVPGEEWRIVIGGYNL